MYTIPTREYVVGASSICVAYYEDRYELTIMTEIGEDAYNHLVLYFTPEEFEQMSKQWTDLIFESKQLNGVNV